MTTKLDKLFQKAMQAASSEASPSRSPKIKPKAHGVSKKTVSEKTTTPAKSKKPKIFKKADFSDEDEVLRDFASAEGEDASNFTIKSSRNTRTSSEMYVISSGRREYMIAEDEDAAHAEAVAQVKEDLENEPEMFEKNFLRSHIDIKHLRAELMSDVVDMRYEDLSEEARKRPLQFLKDNDIDIPSPTKEQIRKHAIAMGDDEADAKRIFDEIDAMEDPEDQWIELGEEPEVDDSDIMRVAEEEAESQLKDPISYLEDIYSDSEATEQAIKIGGIDVDSAADEAVSADGWEHFLAHYDGNSHRTPSGFVYWQTN